MVRGLNEILSAGLRLHQPSHASEDVSTLVVEWLLLIDIPFHILGSVLFPFCMMLNISQASHEFLDANPISEAWETESGVFFLQHVVIVPLHAILQNSAMDIFVLFTSYTQVVQIVLEVLLMPTLSIAFRRVCNVFAWQCTSARVCFRPWQNRWQW
jgi:hypothetical protein